MGGGRGRALSGRMPLKETNLAKELKKGLRSVQRDGVRVMGSGDEVYLDANLRLRLGQGGPHLGAGAGCGAGLGIALVGASGFGPLGSMSPNVVNGINPVFGIGAGCGVGIGFGVGMGMGASWNINDWLQNTFGSNKLVLR